MAAPHPHVVLFPVPAQGHLNPFLWLADYLASAGISVTVVHTARSFSLLSRNATSTLASPSSTSNPRIEVVPDDVTEDWLSDDKSNTDPRRQLYASFPAMEKGLDELLQKLTKENGYAPSCIIMDNFFPWTRKVADKHGIPWIEFWTCSATVYSMMLRTPELAEKGYLPLQPGSEMKMVDFVPGLAPFPIGAFPEGFGTLDIISRYFEYICSICEHNRKTDRVLVYSFYDLESVVIDALRHQKIPIEPIGPFISTKRLAPASLLPEDGSCLGWLDAQEEASVLYVSFGSMAIVDNETIQELALGLELSQVRFLWVIRPDSVKGALGDLLPEGFQSRTQDRGRIITWAPQLAVLAHPTVGAFLTHCGWNSVLESLYMGVPMIGFPDAAEQNTNLKCIIDWKVGMALDAEGSGKCNRAAVERVVRAMNGEEGSEARRRAREMRGASRKATQDGSSKANLERLVEYLKCGRFNAPRPTPNAS